MQTIIIRKWVAHRQREPSQPMVSIGRPEVLEQMGTVKVRRKDASFKLDADIPDA